MSADTLGLSAEPTVEVLAPVPLDLLLDARDHFSGRELALGSRAWEVFRRLDAIRTDHAVRVWIYASHNPDQPSPASATWTAYYVRCVDSMGGAHPDSEHFRSPIARPEDGLAYWAIYWHVEGLRQLEASEYQPVSQMRGLDQRKPYGRPFEPEGPILIEPVA